MREVRQGQFYRHFKGRLYQITAVAEHSETGEHMVVYQALYGDYRVYVRPYEMFVSEVDHEKYPQVKQKYRFELVDLAEEKCTKQEKPDQPDIFLVKKESKTKVSEEKAEESKNAQSAWNQTEKDSVNPILLEFLDAETLEEKLHIMIFGRNQMDDNLLNSIAISLDLVVDEKNTQEKYDEILNCLSMMEKFECNRLR